MQIYELKLKDGRMFRIAPENKSQENRMFKIVNDCKANNTFKSFECVVNGVHNIKHFESILSEDATIKI